MRRSTVVNEEAGDATSGDWDVVDNVRTSYGAFLTRLQDPIVQALEERIALWTHLNLTNQEDPQVLRYARGQEYQAHYDDLEEETPRIATVIVYLSDVVAGGETVFPFGRGLGETNSDDGIKVAPKRGDALLFWSLDSTMKEDVYSMHAGAPVVDGVKWTMTVWIHSGPFRPETLEEEARLDWRGLPQECKDFDAHCNEWARAGECESNRVFMVGGGSLGACRKSCGACRECRAGDEACEDENREKGGFLPLYTMQ